MVNVLTFMFIYSNAMTTCRNVENNDRRGWDEGTSLHLLYVHIRICATLNGVVFSGPNRP